VLGYGLILLFPYHFWKRALGT